MTTTPIANEFVDIHARLDPSARMDLAMSVLAVGNLPITGLLMHRLGSSKTSHFKNAFFADGGGLEIFLKELVKRFPDAETCISRAVGRNAALKEVSAEMDLVKTYTLLSSTEVTPHSMRDWTVGIPKHLAPFLSSVLHACAVSGRAVQENKTKKDTFTVSVHSQEAHELTQSQIVNVVIHQLANFRSQNSQRFQVPFGLSLLAHGTPRAVVDMLNRLHLSPCFDTISSTAVTLANGCITEAIAIVKDPHVLAYDNIQVSSSPLIEQREGAPATVRSGTVSVIYPALNAEPNDMTLTQIRRNWCKTEGLSYAHDLRQTREQLECHFEQLVVHTVRVLRHLKGSEDIVNHQDCQHVERRNSRQATRQSSTPFVRHTSRKPPFKETLQWSRTFTSLNSGCLKPISKTERFPVSTISSPTHGSAQPNSLAPLTTTHSLASSFCNSVSVFSTHT
jgi:hypothetical protein